MARIGAMAGGFVPVRQLVLVDLLSMVLGVRPGERAVVAVDSAQGAGTARLCAELRALAGHVAGRDMLVVSLGEPEVADVATVLDRFRAGESVAAPLQTGGSTPPARDERPGPDAVLLVAGAYLLRPAVAGHWDASVYVETEVGRSPAEQLYREQVPEQRATWVLDDRRREAPILTDGAGSRPDPAEGTA